jgi:hypothetical protein
MALEDEAKSFRKGPSWLCPLKYASEQKMTGKDQNGAPNSKM